MFKPQSPIKQSGFSLIIILICILILLFLAACYFLISRSSENRLLIKSNNQQLEYQERKKALESSAPQPSSLLGGTASLSNPASDYCIKAGGSLISNVRGDGGEYNTCLFEDNMSCEEWALYRGYCPIGGIKTIGYDTKEEIYCAQLGGKALASSNSKCTLPDGNICSNFDLYNGKCQ